MLNKLWDAIATRVERRIKESARGERAAEAKHARELINEMEDVLEKFSRVVAREGMRRSRDAKRMMDEQLLEEAAVPKVAAAAGNDIASRKAAARARLRERGTQMTGSDE